ncbi:MAG: septation protein IspZ [Rhodospirillaceae bacterium]|nr:septation protein IspZ [Rhodospirillaceae bacterium]MBT5263806.1 septation protein IspZ [Rhodospirillaceae bacterium]MBT6138826.1 septation protein IspZ [Rhodospirillaceae bacterium]
MPRQVKLAVEFGPLVAFFIGNFGWGIMAGTGALMVAASIAIAVAWSIERRVPMMVAVSTVLVLTFGGLTLALDDEDFIKLKPTIVNLLFAAAIFGGMLIGRNPLKTVMGHALSLSEAGWRALGWRWILAFIGLAGLNEAVWRSVDTDTWVSFKVFGLPVLLMIIAMGSVLSVRQHMIEAEKAE